MKNSKCIVDSRLWIRLDLDTSLKGNILFKIDPRNRAHLASQFLLYDKIIIPTKDYGIIPILISWMGLSTFKNALESNSLGFIYLKSMLGYSGRGTGLTNFIIKDSKDHPFQWYQASMFGSYEDAPDYQLKYQVPFLNKHERFKIVDLILKHSKYFELSQDEFNKYIVKESYTDIQNDESLLNFIISHEQNKKIVNLKKLSGIKIDQYRVLNLEKINNGIDLVLRVAEINIEIILAHLYSEADIGTSKGADKLLEQKVRRALVKEEDSIKQFYSLLELFRLPDIRSAIISDELTMTDIWKIRMNRKAKKFRRWLGDVNTSNSRELEQAYVAALGKSSIFNSVPLRVIRFLTTTAIGAINPPLGIISGTSDSFFINKWLDGYSPKLFLEDIRKLPYNN